MKKTTMLAVALAAGLGYSSAWAAEVVSSNVVGYNKIALQPGFNMIGVQFKAVGSPENALGIQTVSPTGLTGFDWDAFDGGDTLLIWDPTTQGYNETYIWAGADDTTDALGYDISGTWFDGETFESVERDLTSGTALWIRSAGSGTATISGEVPALDTPISAEIVGGGFSMIANPFPVPLAINGGMTVSGLVGFDWDAFDGGDTLLVWDPASQGYTATYIWAGTDDTTDALGYDISGTWFDGETFESTDATIPVGGAMWIKTSGSGATVTFKAPENN